MRMKFLLGLGCRGTKVRHGVKEMKSEGVVFRTLPVRGLKVNRHSSIHLLITEQLGCLLSSLVPRTRHQSNPGVIQLILGVALKC